MPSTKDSGYKSTVPESGIKMSSTTSQKHRNFVAEPMGKKPVEDLPGIGDAHGQMLRQKGFDKVRFLEH